MPGAHVPEADSPADGAGPHLRIGDAARRVGVSPSALRLWERQQLIRPARSRAGYRLYSETDIARLRQVRRMRSEQVNAPGIRRILPSERGAGGRGPAALDAGRRLRELRQQKHLSLRQAGERAGVSASFLSALERGDTAASVGTLQRLTSLYGATLADLVDAPPMPKRLVRHAERRRLEVPATGVRIEQLAEGAQQLEPQLFVLAPGADSASAYAHAGEECVYVLDGAVTFWLGENERYRLRAGDSLTFPSNLPHRWRNRADGETRLLWINTPPTF